LAVLATAIGLVNPSLQPGDLVERRRIVLALRVERIDLDTKVVSLSVQRVFKGTFAPQTVELALVGDQPQEAFFAVLHRGHTVVAMIGDSRKPLDLLFYAGGEGRWQSGAVASADEPGRWQWTRDLGQALFGTYNGDSSRLADLIADQFAGRPYFPAARIDSFADDRVLGTLAGPGRGVALIDLDGDDRLDVYACSPAGDRVWMQTAPLVFTDRTSELGLAGSASVSVNAADIDGDGRIDLLLDGSLRRRLADGRFAATETLPEAAGAVLQAFFVDADGDGHPDALVSRRGSGLRLYRNPGTGGTFTEMPGLDRRDGTGFAMWGDWNGDQRPDVFHASGGGHLLVQDGHGRFAPVGATPLAFDFSTIAADGITGAGCFAPVWNGTRQDLLFTRDSGIDFAINRDGVVNDAAQYGNELQLASLDHLPLIAEDLNADGTVDLYVGSRSGQPNGYYINRGYGSFMTPFRYWAAVFPGAAHLHGAWGLAAGDVDGDGANDLLLAAPDGRVTLLLNTCLALRQHSEVPTPLERTLAATRLIAIAVRGPRGVIGATVTATAGDGRVVGLRVIGANVATGCRSPDLVNLAIRDPGPVSVQVRWSDGVTRSWSGLAAGDGPRRTLVEAVRPSP